MIGTPFHVQRADIGSRVSENSDVGDDERIIVRLYGAVVSLNSWMLC